MEKQWGTLETDPLEVPEYKGLLGYPFSFGGVNEYADGYEEDDSDNPNSMSVDSQGNLAVGGDFLGAAIDFSPTIPQSIRLGRAPRISTTLRTPMSRATGATPGN